jgi:hypothetical protein
MCSHCRSRNATIIQKAGISLGDAAYPRDINGECDSRGPSAERLHP